MSGKERIRGVGEGGESFGAVGCAVEGSAAAIDSLVGFSASSYLTRFAALSARGALRAICPASAFAISARSSCVSTT